MNFKRVLLGTGIAMACLALAITVRASYSVQHGPTVTVAVQASDTSGGQLHYRWRATDGVIQNVNAASTTWTLPPGPGLHFAYVLVSNGVGGYTERRIAVNTDTIGTPLATQTTYHALTAPPAAAQVGDYYRAFLVSGNTSQVYHDAYLPDVLAHLEDPATGARYPATGEVLTDPKGQMIVPGVPPGASLLGRCRPPNTQFTDCFGATTLTDATTSYIISGVNNYPNGWIVGSLQLQDGSPCGTFNEFFGVRSTAAAILLDTANRLLAGPVRLNEFGDFTLPSSSTAGSVLFLCEGARPVKVHVTLDPYGFADLGLTKFPGITPPVVSAMTATLQGQLLAPPVAIFLPPPSGFPSDIIPRSDGFLAEKGLDSRLGACQYYKAVGAVQACDFAGNFVGAITFKDWRHAVKIGEFATGGTPTYTASYINKVDLNLARVHESITYGPNNTAGVVCNHLGPPGGTPDQLVNPSQADIDTAVDNAVNNKNLVACVAMDYTVSPGVNNGQPFVRFLIFGPSGNLLPSINLDGRREKFVPGTCVVCHGGDHYAGKFPEDGSGFANVGGHFLPYDVGNFEFSSKPGLTESDQELAIYHLNQNSLNAGPTQAERDLISGWYTNGTTLDKEYLPSSWQATGDGDAFAFYGTVVARSCRTCHVALREEYNFDHYSNIAPPYLENAVFGDVGYDMGINTCGGSAQFGRDHMMPNSLITFNRFWLSAGTANDQPAQLQTFYGSDTGFDGNCPAPAGELP